MAASKLWRNLTPQQKAYQKKRGVTPSSYNAWWKKPVSVRRELTQQSGGLKGPAALHKVRQQQKARRAVNRAQSSALRIHKAYQHVLTILAGLIRSGVADPHRILDHVTAMDDTELTQTLKATEIDYRQYAAPQVGWRTVRAIEVNPFWYHPY